MAEESIHPGIRALFEAESIAIIGATEQTGKIGYSICEYLQVHPSKKYYVNPKYSEIWGGKCYHSILDIQEEIDITILATPHFTVLPLLEEITKTRTKAVIIVSGGFGEWSLYSSQKTFICQASVLMGQSM